MANFAGTCTSDNKGLLLLLLLLLLIVNVMFMFDNLLCFRFWGMGQRMKISPFIYSILLLNNEHCPY